MNAEYEHLLCKKHLTSRDHARYCEILTDLTQCPKCTASVRVEISGFGPRQFVDTTCMTCSWSDGAELPETA